MIQRRTQNTTPRQIGERITWGCMKHPVEHFNRLVDRLDKAQNRGESITLTILER